MLKTSPSRISVRWPIYITNSTENTNNSRVPLPHRRKTTVSLLQTYNPFILKRAWITQFKRLINNGFAPETISILFLYINPNIVEKMKSFLAISSHKGNDCAKE